MTKYFVPAKVNHLYQTLFKLSFIRHVWSLTVQCWDQRRQCRYWFSFTQLSNEVQCLSWVRQNMILLRSRWFSMDGLNGTARLESQCCNNTSWTRQFLYCRIYEWQTSVPDVLTYVIIVMESTLIVQIRWTQQCQANQLNEDRSAFDVECACLGCYKHAWLLDMLWWIIMNRFPREVI